MSMTLRQFIGFIEQINEITKIETGEGDGDTEGKQRHTLESAAAQQAEAMKMFGKKKDDG